jgi:hypothetical protein
MHHAPLLSNAGEVHAVVSPGWEAQAAWSPADRFALVGAASHFDRRSSDGRYGVFTSGWDMIEEPLAHTYIEGGIGAYRRLGDRHRLEGFIGYGSGTMSELIAGRFSMNVRDIDYRRLFFQGNYGMTSDIGVFRGAVGCSMRSAWMWCGRYETSGVPGNLPHALTLEPAAFLRFGLHMLQFEVQLGGLLDVVGDDNDTFGSGSLALSFGLHGMLGKGP